MTGRQLFCKRLKEEWTYQWNIIKTVLDWTIILYLVIPTVVIGSFMYAEAWQSIELYWSSLIPFPLLLLVLLLLTASGNFRTYLQEADLLYLLQQKPLLHGLKRYGLAWSSFTIMTGTALIFVFILPILLQSYQLSLPEVFHLYIALLAFRLLMITCKKIISRTLTKWLVYPLLFAAVFALLFSVRPVLYGIVGFVCIILLYLYQLSQLTKTNRWFQREIEMEKAERIKYIKVILNFSNEVEKEKISTKKRPWILFPQSNRIFKTRSKENGLLELLLKSFLRSPLYLKSYYQMTTVTIVAIIILPLWLKWLVFIAFFFFISSWLKSIFNKMKKHSFFAVAPYKEELEDAVWPRFNRWITLPAVSVIGLTVTLLTFL
nr:ABC transporter permease [uncultured Bacillus sp.]